ncbi:predicted protein [Botrytis cinerea T4]|uniref:Uncharacterized protein n=1 Tax=Botryotinia fuckeliana (strain T4) TaxID=999810 RepID=G2YXL0_BOTF4|nr:predicted protein [Botrytis cinerea T4]
MTLTAPQRTNLKNQTMCSVKVEIKKRMLKIRIPS